MRVEEIDKIHGVSCYVDTGNELCFAYLDESTLYIGDTSVSLEQEIDKSTLNFVDGLLCWQANSGSASLLYSLSEQKVMRQDEQSGTRVGYYKMQTLIGNSILMWEVNEELDANYLYDITNQASKTLPFDPRYHGFDGQQHIFLAYGDFELEETVREDVRAYNPDGELLWVFPLRGSTSNGFQNDVPLELNAALGIYDGKLWLKLSSYDIVALDLATGEEVARLQFERNVTEYLQLDARQGCLFGTSRQQYFHVDLTEPELRVQKGDIRGLAEAGIRSVFTEYYFCFNDAFLFVAEPTTGAVAMIDRQQWQVVHGFKPEMIGNSLRKLNGTSLQGNKFYLLDGANTLHIYQWQA
ncbi:hypothetical protein [Motilimonas sp. KMU-193]|uniref:hypothetical protein n=1 Tax=Motilimonas sp. KMU-193 TaxID=3388668 RepID=UPI00396B3BD4